MQTDKDTLVDALMAEDPREPWPPIARVGSVALECWRSLKPTRTRTAIRPSTPAELHDWYKRVGQGH
jgi:hypothetical protein